MRILFPDSLSSTSQLSGSAFLFFNEQPIFITLHPTVSLPLAGSNPFSFISYAEDKNPFWLKIIKDLMNTWIGHQAKLLKMKKLIMPLHKKAYSTILLSYPRNEGALERSKEILRRMNISVEEMFKLIDYENASEELISHIFFEKFLELYDNGYRNPIKICPKTEFIEKKVNYADLYYYCEELFSKNSIESLLVYSYLFRFTLLAQENDILLSNRNLFPAISELAKDSANIASSEDISDIISWEVFRTLLSPYSDIITRENIGNIKNALLMRMSEINNLKLKCFEVSKNLSQTLTQEQLQLELTSYIRSNMQKDINYVLQMKKDIFHDYMFKILPDEKAWLSVGGIIASILMKKQLLTAGSAIAGFAFLGSNMIQSMNERRGSLKSNPYALIYHMSR